MESIAGKKIFILYPDKGLRDKVFHGELRNEYEIYYLHNYEKIAALAKAFPDLIICINLIKNDFAWLLEEVRDAVSEAAPGGGVELITFTDKPLEDVPSDVRQLVFSGDYLMFREQVDLVLRNAGAKGRRNIVRYGGVGESVAGIEIEADGEACRGIVNDISISGLSCRLDCTLEFPVSETPLNVSLDLDGSSLKIVAYKVLERIIGGERIHILQFSRSSDTEQRERLYDFIHSSLDAQMDSLMERLRD